MTYRREATKPHNVQGSKHMLNKTSENRNIRAMFKMQRPTEIKPSIPETQHPDFWWEGIPQSWAHYTRKSELLVDMRCASGSFVVLKNGTNLCISLKYHKIFKHLQLLSFQFFWFSHSIVEESGTMIWRLNNSQMNIPHISKMLHTHKNKQFQL